MTLTILISMARVNSFLNQNQSYKPRQKIWLSLLPTVKMILKKNHLASL